MGLIPKLLIALPLLLAAGFLVLRHPSFLIALSVYTISLDHMGRLDLGPLTLNNLVKAALVGIAFIWMLDQKNRLVFPRHLVWFLPFLLFTGITALYGANQLNATFYLYRLFIVWLYALIVSNFIRTERDLVVLMIAIVGTALVVSVLAHLQTLNVLTRGAVMMVEKQGPDASGVRAVSTFWDSNKMGQFLVVLSIIMTSALSLPRLKWPWKLLILLTLFSAFGAILLSFSRSAWLALGLALAFMLFAKRSRRIALVFATVGLLGILYMAMFTPYGSFLFNRLTSLGELGEDFSGRFRWLLGMSGLRIWTDGFHWLWGSGFFSFPEVVARYWHPAMSHQMIYHAGTKTSHTFYITILAEGGMISFLLLLVFARSVYIELRRAFARRLAAFPRGILTAIAVLLAVRVVDLFLNPTFHDNLLWFMLGLLGALSQFPEVDRAVDRTRLTRD